MRHFLLLLAKWFIVSTIILNTARYGAIVQTQSQNCCPDLWLPFNQSCYLFSNVRGMHYVEAEHYCLHHHASHLVTIESAKENAFLRDYASRLKGEEYWIGLSDELIEGIWRWESTGNTVVYTDWFPGQPTNCCGGEDCVSLHADFDYHWNDNACDANFRPLCEKSRETPVEVIG